MSLLSRLAAYFKQPSTLQEDIDIAAKLDHTLRIMGTGPCTCSVVVGILNVRCPCQHGVFDIQSQSKTQGDKECQACTHPLSQHEDFRSFSSSKNSSQAQPLLKHADADSCLQSQPLF